MEHNLTDTEITEIPETDEPTPENDSLFTGDDLMKIVLTAALVWTVKELSLIHLRRCLRRR